MTASLDVTPLDRTSHDRTSRRRRSTSPDPTGPAVWADAWRAEVPDVPVPTPRTAVVASAAPAPAVARASRGWRDRLWQLFGVLAVVLPMLGLVLSATTGQELWLLPAAAVAALVAVALTVWA